MIDNRKFGNSSVDENELISIIVPVYNVELYLEECIGSILKQTYENIEILLIDDGSTDNSPQICDSYAKKDTRIKVIHKENGGQALARNVGIKNAQGSYYMFIDSDDYIDAYMVEKLYKALKQSDSDMAMCNIKYIYENIPETQLDVSPIKDEVLSSEEAINKLFSEKYWYYIGACNKLHKRKLWDNFEFPEGYIHEDEAVIHRIFKKCKRIVTISDELYYYRQVLGSTTHSGRNEKSLDKYVALSDRLLFLKKCVSNTNLRKLSYQYWYSYLEDFFYFRELNKNSIRLKRMKKSLVKALPVMVKCGFFTKKDTIGILIFLLKPEIYEKLFWKKGEQS